MDLPYSDRAKGFVALIAEDGGSTTYDKWASSYEVDVNSMNYSGYKSVVTKWQAYHSELLSKTGEKHKVFDAGCGTGLVGELVLRSASLEMIQFYGGDISSEMLKIAESKRIYTDLQVVDLKEELPYEANSFDSVISAGVFGIGHCGPECVPNILRILKPGCVFIATVNKKLFDKAPEEWTKFLAECNSELLEKTEIPYLDHVGAFVFVFRKNAV